MLLPTDVLSRQARVKRLKFVETGSGVVNILSVVAQRQRWPGVCVGEVTLLQQFCADTFKIVRRILLELCEFLLQLFSLVCVDRFVVVSCDFDVVLPELSLFFRSRCDFFHFQENVAHHVDTENVGQRHTEWDGTKGQKLNSLVLWVHWLCYEKLESIVEIFENDVNQRVRPEKALKVGKS